MKNNVDKELSDATILFLCEYVQIAWGIHYDGIFINRGGQVFRFGDKTSLTLPPSSPGQSRAEYLSWVSEHAVLEKQIDRAVMDDKEKLIMAASQGKTISEPGLFDAGMVSYHAYLWQGDQLNEILLSSTGEQQRTNQSPEAVELVEWLKKVWDRR